MNAVHPIINQEHYGNLSIDNNENDCIIIWCHEKTEANCVIVERENIKQFIELLETLTP